MSKELSVENEGLNVLIISNEIIINKKYILKSLKYYIYILILNNYEINKLLYYQLLNNLITELFIIDIDIYKFMFKSLKLYKNFIYECCNNIINNDDTTLYSDEYKKFDKYFRLLLHFIFWTNYIQADNMYALSCIQAFVLLFDIEKLNTFNYINLIFHLSSDLTTIYDNIRKKPTTRDTGSAGGGDVLEDIKLVANKYSKILNISESTQSETEITNAELNEYKKLVNNDYNNGKVSDSYIDAILNLHIEPFSKQTLELLDKFIMLQLKLLLTININKYALYEFIKYCIKNKNTQIYKFK